MIPAQNVLNDEQKKWIQSNPKFPERLTVQGRVNKIDYLILERDSNGLIHNLGSRMGFKGFVLKVQDIETQAIYAAKICIPEDYDVDERSEFIECQLATKLRSAGSLFVVPFRVGRVDKFPGMPGSQTKFVCFVTDWIEGETVELITRGIKNEIKLDPVFACTVIEETLRGVHYLKSKGLKHDDLHCGNIMVRKIDPGLVLTEAESQKLEVSIIDMGSLKPFNQPTAKSKDDDLYLLSLIVQLYNALKRDRQIVTKYPIFFVKLKKFALELADEDHLRFYLDDKNKLTAIDDIRKVIEYGESNDNKQSFHPFEAISAEHLTDDKVLLSLFVNKLPWFNQAFSPKPLVLTGPRGCGKSMLFRYMAARTHSASSNINASEYNPNFFGVYFNCSTYLQNSLMWIARKEGRVRENAEAIVTFFNLVVAREFFRAIESAKLNTLADQYFGLNDIGIDQLIEHTKYLFDKPIETPRISTKSHALHFADDLDRARVLLQNDLLHQRQPSILLSETFIADITSKLQEYLPKLGTAGVVFLLDDYSRTRVHPEIQKVLNKIIFERRSSHYFKISCEKFGFLSEDVDLVRIDETREYEVIDAGDQAVFEMPDNIKEDFIKSLINRRLEAANWQGRVKTLIGHSGFSDDVKLVKYIRENASTKGKHNYYRGIDHLSLLWSGDIATILQVVRDMFLRANITHLSNSLISDQIQHESIVQVSKAFRERIAGYYPLGCEMAKVVNEFGAMANTILCKGKLTNDGQPRRLYRIEMTKNEKLPLLSLLQKENPKANEIACELLRRAVFIELSDSRGKEGQARPTARWEMRKIFLPSFGLSLVRNSYIDIKTTQEFAKLFIDPEQFREIQVNKYIQNPNCSLFDDIGD